METTAPRDSASTKRVWLAVGLSVVLPGLGHAYVGRYRRAALWVSPLVVFVVGAILAARSGTAVLVGAALSPEVLWTMVGIDILSALWRVGASLDVYALLSQDRDRAPRTSLFALAGWFAVGLVVFVPHAAIGRLTVDALTLVDTVFVLEGEGVPTDPIFPIGADADLVPDPAIPTTSATTTTVTPTPAGVVTPPSPDKVAAALVTTTSAALYGDEVLRFLAGDPDVQDALRDDIFNSGLDDVKATSAWKMIAGEPNAGSPSPLVSPDTNITSGRITILLAGGDGGPGRGGMRTDTMMVATLDPATGQAALFGFPRNLGHTPLPSRFENAFTGLQQRIAPNPEAAVTNCKCFPEQLNALYPFTRKWTKSYPDEVDPGMAALRDTLQHVMGIPIDYYALADMAAFVDLVDAIDGVDVLVQKPLVAEVSPPREGDPWAKVDVDVGWNHLDGPQALAYARARKGSSDYARMQRQRCMVRAVAAKAEPLNLLLSFSAIVDAVEGSVVTDIPLSEAPDLLTAAAKLDFSDIETVGFVHGYWEEERDHLGHPIPNLSRIRSKVARVFEGQPPDAVEEIAESECDV